MSRIDFGKTIRTKYLGRNGYHNCQGLSVTHTELGGERTIFIEPINTRDEVGRARIEVPDQEDIVIELVSDLLNVAQHRVISSQVIFLISALTYFPIYYVVMVYMLQMIPMPRRGWKPGT